MDILTLFISAVIRNNYSDTSAISAVKANFTSALSAVKELSMNRRVIRENREKWIKTSIQRQI